MSDEPTSKELAEALRGKLLEIKALQQQLESRGFISTFYVYKCGIQVSILKEVRL